LLAASTSAQTDPFFAYRDVQPEFAHPLARRLPAYPCTASPPPLYSEGLKWGSDLLLRAEEQSLPYPGDVCPTLEQPHWGTALGLYMPQTDEPTGSRPRGPSVDSFMDCHPEPEQMRASRATTAQASYRSSSPGRQGQSGCGDRPHYADPCSPILRRVPKLLATILLATSSSIPAAAR
jgi:hypothetical protein